MSKSTVIANGKVVLTSNDAGEVFNERHEKVAQIMGPKNGGPSGAGEFAVLPNHSVKNSKLGILGSSSDGRICDRLGNIVGATDGPVSVEIGAAYIALDRVEETVHLPIYVYRRLKDDEPPLDPPGCLEILISLCAIGLALLFLGVFIVGSIETWGGMMATAAFVTFMFVRPISATDPRPVSDMEDFEIEAISHKWAITFGCLISVFGSLMGGRIASILAILSFALGIFFLRKTSVRGTKWLRSKIQDRPLTWEKAPAIRNFLITNEKKAYKGSLILLGVTTVIVLGFGITLGPGVGSGVSHDILRTDNNLSGPGTPARVRPQVQSPSQPEQKVLPPTPPAESKPATTESQPAGKQEVSSQATAQPSALAQTPPATPTPPAAKPDANHASQDLTKLTAFELKCMRNEPYAKHGYIFKSKDLTDFFSMQPWYKPSTPDQNTIWTQLNQEEKDLIDRVKKEESRRNGH